MTTFARVVDALELEPDGITARQLCAKYWMPTYNAASVLTKLHAKGIVERIPIPGRARECVWRLKERSPC